ncbi:hypothetical protein CLF_101464 [Clonorchis sinensis]|uniref:Uncharacterized protein n=1 Tax=Clonorchis sinensis TaxID=79923 RepID=G7Y5T5_CLOSI|nr:hypothetical protein CLF_101464 [Clonorchis sinensis]
MTSVFNTDASLPYNHDLFESFIVKKRIKVKGWPPLRFRHPDLGMENSTLFDKRCSGILNTCLNKRSFLLVRTKGAKKYALVLVQKGLTRALFQALYSESTEATPSEEFMIHIHQVNRPTVPHGSHTSTHLFHNALPNLESIPSTPINHVTAIETDNKNATDIGWQPYLADDSASKATRLMAPRDGRFGLGLFLDETSVIEKRSKMKRQFTCKVVVLFDRLNPLKSCSFGLLRKLLEEPTRPKWNIDTRPPSTKEIPREMLFLRRDKATVQESLTSKISTVVRSRDGVIEAVMRLLESRYLVIEQAPRSTETSSTNKFGGCHVLLKPTYRLPKRAVLRAYIGLAQNALNIITQGLWLDGSQSTQMSLSLMMTTMTGQA